MYPDGWVVLASPANNKDLKREEVPPEIQKWMKKNNVDLSKVSMMLVHSGNDDFLENLNVVVDSQQIPVNDATVQKITAELPQQYGTMGVVVRDVRVRVEKIGNRDAIVVDFQSNIPGVAVPLKQRQVMFPGGGKTYIVTCTAKAKNFERTVKTFDWILASFKAPEMAPLGFHFDWNQSLMKGIVGGVIGGLVGLVVWVNKKIAAAKRERLINEELEEKFKMLS